MTARTGRRSYIPDEKTRKQVKTLSGMGVPDFDIAKVIGISGPTMRKYYAAELETGHIEANAQVAQSLYRQATNKDKPNVAAGIFWMKCRGGWKEETEDMGKKDAAKSQAKRVAAGKFSPSAPPKLVVNNR